MSTPDADLRRSVLGTKLPVALLTSPFQLGVAWAAVALSLGVIATTIIPALGIFSLIQSAVPVAVVLIWATFLFLGGVGVLISTFGRDLNPPRAIVLEAPSHIILGTAWLIYAVVPLLAGGLLAAAPFGACLAIASFLRVRAMVVAVRATSTARELTKGSP